jgi:hypothetical protein
VTDPEEMAAMPENNAGDRDAEIESTSDADSAAVRLFDVRRVIGGLFTLYGVLVLGAGIVDGKGASDKASGIDINIWTGLGMLLLGLGMLVWMWLSPTAVAEQQPDSDRRSGGH